GHGLLDVLAHVFLWIELRLLGQEADAGAFRRKGLAGEVLVDPGHDAQQRALAGSVRAQHADLGAGIERQPDALEDLLALRRDLAQVLHREDVLRCHTDLPPQQPSCWTSETAILSQLRGAGDAGTLRRAVT